MTERGGSLGTQRRGQSGIKLGIEIQVPACPPRPGVLNSSLSHPRVEGQRYRGKPEM